MREELKINVLIDKPYVMDLNEDLSISKERINDELSKQPAMFAWYATLYELARSKTLKLKQSLDTIEAELNLEVRTETSKIKSEDSRYANLKLTETTIESIVRTNEKFKLAEDNYLTAKKDEGMLLVAKVAFEQRKDMLISLASNMRSELDGELSILKNNADLAIKSTKKIKGD